MPRPHHSGNQPFLSDFDLYTENQNDAFLIPQTLSEKLDISVRRFYSL